MQHCVLVYRVQPKGKHWTICFGGFPCGEFDSRRDALHSAAADARRVRRMGHVVHVRVARPPDCERPLPDKMLPALH
ncbi:hypothetical protein [Aureimonas sp. D3]|uniref:hypothetical protein n=1 Tax=Aureimonas sp. D3 TaxID=1638164 RepID=UPI000780D7CE|nr:hypothetical protein [Aureimonas sp. D3]